MHAGGRLYTGTEPARGTDRAESEEFDVSSDQNDADPYDEMGPIDYVVVEFPGQVKAGEGLPLFVNLVDRGIVRILDLAFVRKERDGTVYSLSLEDVGPDLAVFEGASSGLLRQADIDN